MCVTAQVGRGCKRQPCGLHRTEIGILEGNDIGICRPSRVRLNPDIGRPYLLSRDKRCALCDFERSLRFRVNWGSNPTPASLSYGTRPESTECTTRPQVPSRNSKFALPGSRPPVCVPLTR